MKRKTNQKNNSVLPIPSRSPPKRIPPCSPTASSCQTAAPYLSRGSITTEDSNSRRNRIDKALGSLIMKIDNDVEPISDDGVPNLPSYSPAIHPRATISVRIGSQRCFDMSSVYYVGHLSLFHSSAAISRPIISATSRTIIFNCGTEYSEFDGTINRF